MAGSPLPRRLGGLPGRCPGSMEKRRFRDALRDVGAKNMGDQIEWAESRGVMCD